MVGRLAARAPDAIGTGSARGSADATPCEVTTVAPQCSSEWDAFVTGHSDGTLFHTTAWRDAVKDSFGHDDIYLTAVRNGIIVGVLPMFLVKSRIGGRMLVSVPYGVGGGILADDDEAVTALFDAAKHLCAKRDCNVIDMRSERAIVPGVPTVNRYAGFRRALPDDPEKVLAWLPRKARAAARNARCKYGLRVSFGDEHLAEVWRLYSVSMRRLASLTYPFRFFERLIELTPDRHWVSLVTWDGRTVAGLVTFLFRDCVIPYFIGTTNEARRCSAANYVYLTAMERGAASGYRVFDFGRSRRDNEGSYNFKRFNGFTPHPLHYQIYTPPGCKAPDLSPNNPRFRLARNLWRYLPLCVTRAAGGRLARHIPG